jgi:hypothetical protein
MKLIDSSLVDIIASYVDGSIAGGNFVGEVGLAPYHDFDGSVAADALALLDRANSGLRSGAVLTCYNLDLSGLRVGLVTDVGQVDDGSFNESAWNGVLATGACGA